MGSRIKLKIEKLMSKKGIESHRQLALRSGVSTATLSFIVRGKVTPSSRVAARLSSTLGMRPRELYEVLHIYNPKKIERAEKLYENWSSFSSHSSADMLNQNYSLAIGKLESLYQQSNPVVKAQLLGGLELLVKLYETS